MLEVLIVAVVVAVPVLYAVDRVLKARARARRLRTMSDRLAGATARADEQRRRRRAATQASAALTFVMPAIKRPPLTLPDEPAPDEAAPGDRVTCPAGRAGSARRSARPRG